MPGRILRSKSAKIASIVSPCSGGETSMLLEISPGSTSGRTGLSRNVLL
jgi:hypothetical protein